MKEVLINKKNQKDERNTSKKIIFAKLTNKSTISNLLKNHKTYIHYSV